MGKEGSINIKFIGSVLFFSALMMLVVFAVNVEFLSKPVAAEINTTASRNINFTFNVTWGIGNTGFQSNCSLWTNFSGTWSEAIVNDTSNSKITNQSVSYINYTFTRDIGLMVWSIACYNTTGPTSVLNFTTNRTLSIDVNAPTVVQSADIFQGFNTSSATPTVTINVTDLNGTGINITGDGNNSLNISLYDVSDGADALLRTYNASNENLTCSPTGTAVTSTQCTIDISAFSLTNGTKNLTIFVTDRGGHTNQTSFTFTVDNIAPIYVYYNFTNASSINFSTGASLSTTGYELGTTAGTSRAQGDAVTGVIFALANWTDNLTAAR